MRSVSLWWIVRKPVVIIIISIIHLKRSNIPREMVKALQEYRVDVYGYDPLLSREEIEGFGVKAAGELDGVKPGLS